MDLKHEVKVINLVDSDDFNDFVESKYGGSFEFEAIQEAYEASYDFRVPNKYSNDFGDMTKIRSGKYPMYCAHAVFQCLFEDGFIDAGDYIVKCM